MLRTILLVLSLCLLVMTGRAQAAPAVTCHVPASYATVQAAIDDAACSEIVVAAGYFFGPDITLYIDRSLTLRGVGQTSTYLNYKLLITNDAVVTAEDLTITDSLTHGVELSSFSAGFIGTRITIERGFGWGIDNTFGVNTGNTFAVLRDCIIIANAGGINVGRLTMTNCAVHGNNLYGGVTLFSDSTITNSSIYNNQQSRTTDDGAGVLFDGSGATLLIDQSSIYDNTTHIDPTNPTADGGGIMVRRGHVTVRQSTVRDNLAARRGGGIAVHDIFAASLTLEASSVRNNIAYHGGGGLSVGNDTTVTFSTISNNTARYDPNFNPGGFGSGGGVYVYSDPTLVINTTTIADNVTTTAGSTVPPLSGGGLYVAPDMLGGSITLVQSTINGNAALGDGGGVAGREGTTLRNVTVADNRANGDGGGVFSDGSATFLYHTTVVGNRADDDEDGTGDGGGVAGVVRTDHTLVALNLDPSGAETADCSDGGVSLGYSLLGIADGCPNFKQTGTDLVGDVNSPFDPKIDKLLADNGGPTKTIALAPDTPPTDAGSPTCGGTTVDQRGYGRAGQDGNGNGGDGNPCDIGAFELSKAVPTAVTLRGATADGGRLGVALVGWLLAGVGTVLIWRRWGGKR